MLSQACKYAIRAVLHLAERASGDPRLCKDIARELDVPADYLAKILQALVRHGHMASSKGRGGGFRLNRSADEIRLLDIVEAVGRQGFSTRSVFSGSSFVTKIRHARFTASGPPSRGTLSRC